MNQQVKTEGMTKYCRDLWSTSNVFLENAFYDSMLKLKPKEILTSKFQNEQQVNFCILYWMR